MNIDLSRRALFSKENYDEISNIDETSIWNRATSDHQVVGDDNGVQRVFERTVLASYHHILLGEKSIRRVFERNLLSSLYNVPFSSINSHDNQQRRLLHFCGVNNNINQTEQDSRSDIVHAANQARESRTRAGYFTDHNEAESTYYLQMGISKFNVVAITEGDDGVYLRNLDDPLDRSGILYEEPPSDECMSLAWGMGRGNEHLLALGGLDGEINIYDSNREVFRDNIAPGSPMGHRLTSALDPADCNAITTLTFSNGLTSCGHDGLIVQYDLRVPNYVVQSVQNHDFSGNKKSSTRLMGLKWNEDHSALACSAFGQPIRIWDARKMSKGDKPRMTLDEKEVCSAIDWCPTHRNILASGKFIPLTRALKDVDKIFVWDCTTGERLASMGTAGYCDDLLWSKNGHLCANFCETFLRSNNPVRPGCSRISVWENRNLRFRQVKAYRSDEISCLSRSPRGEDNIVSLSKYGVLREWKSLFDGCHLCPQPTQPIRPTKIRQRCEPYLADTPVVR
jgi:WD40 repeat protein